MKMMDCVEVIVEKEKYARDGVHKGMQGWICLEERGEKDDIATISIREEDMKVVPTMDARINEQIKAQFEKNEEVFQIT